MPPAQSGGDRCHPPTESKSARQKDNLAPGDGGEALITGLLGFGAEDQIGPAALLVEQSLVLMHWTHLPQAPVPTVAVT